LPLAWDEENAGLTQLAFNVTIAMALKFKTRVPTPALRASQQRPRVLMVGFFVRLGQVGGIMDYSKKKQAQLIEETEALQEKIAGLERAQAERKRAVEATKLAHAELDQIFQTAADGMRVIHKDFNVLRVNETFSTLAGVSRDEMVSKKRYEVFAGPDCHTPSCSLTRILGGEERVEYELEKERTDGIRIPCILTATPFRRLDGELIGIVEDFRDITERKRAEEELQHTLEKLREALGGIIQTVALTVEVKDRYTAGHQRRVANLARAIANEMGLPQEQIDGLRMAGLIHDLGKIGIPAEILSKPTRLTEFEWGMIKGHPKVGYDILKKIEFPWPVAQIVLQHHERMDGSGYPQGLSGEEIILEATILGVADVVEAMVSHRPYRSARGIDKALEEISQNKGVLYDPEVVDACLKLFTEKGFTFE